MFSKAEAIDKMNKWGKQGTPFLFIIDFEMNSVELFATKEQLPDYIQFEINHGELSEKNSDKFSFGFEKFPVPISNYKIAFDKTISEIHSGNSFLVNLTFPTEIKTNLSLSEIYKLSNARYKLYFNNKFVVFSPETFVQIKNGYIYSFPMKGTIKADEPNAYERILQNPKEEAEHYTIVDLIRNDLSMVASNVELKRFRYIEKIKTHEGSILQVSSEIKGQLPSDYCNCLGEILFTLLPAGSVTGAPKPKTLEIIKKVEMDERGYYTGIFGFFDGKNLDSAVTIRYIENKNGKLYFRSGGGITFQSNLYDEYNELINKVYVPIT